MNKETNKIMIIVQTAFMAALCYVGFAVFRVDIPVGATKTAFHLGNTFCVLGALLLGGVPGGLAGAIGMTLADLTSGYASSAPKTFFMKLLIGLIVGFVAYKIGHISERRHQKEIAFWAIISSISGMIFNVIFDPIIGFLYNKYILGLPQKAVDIMLKWTATTTIINAILAVCLASSFYMVIRPVLHKQGLIIHKNIVKKL
ncbi:MAG TPA: ECF transporter S component [Candidatus Merdenecus merdavium]|nr:ECF transporter S component [Candidatus Merdenecus merdavium]